MSFLSDLGKVAKSVVRSPITKAVAGGVAVAFPPVGVPALAGLAVADGVTRVIDAGKPGAALVAAGQAALNTPQGQQAMANLGIKQELAAKAAGIVKATAAAAQSDPNAKRALEVMKLAAKARRNDPAAKKKLTAYVATQVKATIAAGKKPGASADEKRAARLVSGVVAAHAARKRAARAYGVNRHTARIVKVA